MADEVTAAQYETITWQSTSALNCNTKTEGIAYTHLYNRNDIIGKQYIICTAYQ